MHRIQYLLVTTQILVETLTTTGLVGSRGTIVILMMVLLLLGVIKTDLSGGDVNLYNVGGVTLVAP